MTIAHKYAAIPYLDGGRDPVRGLDCWGLVRTVLMHEFSVPELPEWGAILDGDHAEFNDAYRTMRSRFKRVVSAKPGDVVCVFNPAGQCAHVGIVINGDTGPTVLDTTTKSGVQTSPMNQYARKYDNRLELRRCR
tara:strand:- start:25694 stop:26098 length:405 start_codon:yes stop_codon:yes gene_type:complete